MPKTQQEERPNPLPFTHQAFRPYVTALGQLSLAWNSLHETLALLFLTVMNGEVSNQYLAVWHALKSDRAQRDILLAATKSGIRTAVPVKFVDDIVWLCWKAAAVEEARDDALHSPLWGYRRGTRDTIIVPGTGLGHVRANNLARKNLLIEFRWCRDAATVLGIFATQIDSSLRDFRVPWPDRPEWPNRGGTNTKKRHRQAHKAKHPPPPRSSQA
jgi:hypothetical protein